MFRTDDRRASGVGLVVLAALLGVVAAAQGALRTTAAPLAQGATCEWQRLSRGDEISNHVLVPVPGRGVLTYGGIRNDRGNGEVKDDVALLDLSITSPDGLWETVTASGASPGKRGEHMAVTRPAESGAQVVTYGGIDSLSGGGTFTWRSPLTAGGRPDGRLETLAPQGVVKNGAVLTLNGSTGTWVALPTDVGPLTDASAVYWPEGDAMVLFGGRTGTETRTSIKMLNVLHLGASPMTWTSTDLPGSPIARFGHSAVYDTAGKRMIVFGGTTDYKTGRNDVWSLDLSSDWNGAKWQSVTPTGRVPGRRFDHAAVYLPALRWMVIYGGSRNGSDALDDMAVLDLSVDPPAWKPVTPTGTAPLGLAYLAGAASDTEAGDMAVFYGGESNGSSKREAWGLLCTSGAPVATATRTTGATVAPGRTATATGTPEPAQTDTPEPGATHTPDATPVPTDLTVTGRVTNAADGSPVPGATVAVGLSVPRQPFSAVTDADGRYSLLVPAQYLPTVDRISVSAVGYSPQSFAVTAAQLAAQPVRDFALAVLVTPTDAPPPVGGKIYLPVTFRGVPAR